MGRTLTAGGSAGARAGARLALVLVVLAVSVLLGAGSARASNPFPFVGSFTGPTLDGGWAMPASETVGGTGGTTNANSALLTGTSTVPGWLQLTAAAATKVGWVYNTTPFPSSSGLVVSFDYADYGGSGADGLTLFLFGQSSNTTGTPLSLTTGPAGGSLGYADCPSSHEDGLTNAYLGVGLDEYGNFGLTNFCGVPTGVGTAGINGTGRYPSYLVVRGPGGAQSGYAYETGAPVVDPGNAAETLKGTSITDTRHVTVVVTPAGLLSVYVTFPDGNTQTVTSSYALATDPPPYLQLGFVASTGGSTDYHDIRTSSVTEPADVQTRVGSSTGNAARGATITDTFTVANAGPNESTATQVTATTAATLSGVSWACSGTCNQTSGSGLPSDTVDLPAGATATYTVTASDNATSDATAAIKLTATPTGATGQSVPGDNVATASTLLPPVALTAPKLALADGTTNYSGVATLTAGTYFGSSVSITHQWQRCIPTGSSCADISGATGTTYATTNADRGSTLRIGEIASNAAGSTAVAYSALFSPLPVTTLSTTTPADTSQTAATFTLGTSNYAASKISYECNLDGAGWSNCATPATFSGLADGSHTLQARSVYAGLSDPNPPTHTWTVDTVAPAPPVISAPANGSYTNKTKPPVSGTAEASSTVKVYIDGTAVGTAAANASGAWSYTPTTALASGTHTVKATATDGAGNVGAYSATNSFTVDTTPPAAPVLTAPANGSHINNNKPPVSGTAEANSTVKVYIDNVAVGTVSASSGGAWSYTPVTALADGSHTFKATATDAAGNVSGSSSTNTVTVDTVAPAAPVVTAPANGSYTNKSKPPVSGTAEASSSVKVYVDATAVATVTASAAGAWSYTPTVALVDGVHTVKATATDAAGNTGVFSSANSFTVDTVAPAAPLLSTPANGSHINNNKPPVSGTAEANSTVKVYIDNVAVGTVSASSGGAWSYTPVTALADGSHTFKATATDAAGNVSGSSSTNTVTVDTVAPAAPLVTAPANGSYTNKSKPPVSGTAEASSSVKVYVDATAVATVTASAAGAWSYTPTVALVDGVHTVKATATDAAGNTGVFSSANSFTVDTVAPAAPLLSTPANGSHINNNKPPVSGTAEANSTVKVYIDNVAVGTVSASSGGAWSYTPVTALADGSHTFKATATDAAGNVSGSSSTNTVTVDTVAPAAPVITAPVNGALTKNNTPPITGTAEASSTVKVYIDGTAVATVTASAAGAWSYAPATALADGGHTVSATATDAAGNTGAFATVRAVTIDTTPPAPPVISTPADRSYTNQTKPPVSGTAEASSTVTVSIDGTAVGTATADGSGAWSLTPPAALADGVHVDSATATDAAGNTGASSAANSFTVDTIPPAAPTIGTPADGSLTNNSKPVVRGTAEANSTVTVYLDGSVAGTATADASGAWSYTPTTVLADGAHAVVATATDAAGNTGSQSSANGFTVDTTPPAAPVVSAPADGSLTNNNKPVVSGTAEAHSTVTVYIDGDAVGAAPADASGAWSFALVAALSDGQHSVSATATDRAGNTGAASVGNTVTVDTTPPAPPVVSAPADGSYTNDNKPPVSGTAEAHSTVTVYLDGGAVGTATADGAGAWSFTPATALPDAVHAVTATATDAAGNTGASSAANSFTVDTIPPAAPVVSAPADGSYTNDNKPPVYGTAEAHSTVTVYVDGAVAGTATTDGSGAWSYTPTTVLADGEHSVSATATDRAGNTGAASVGHTFTVDTIPPAAPVVSAPADGSLTNNNKPVVSGTAEAHSTVTVYIDGDAVGAAPADASGAWSFALVAALCDGQHSVSATATDRAGNTGAASVGNTLTVDTTPPAPPVVSAPADGCLHERQQAAGHRHGRSPQHRDGVHRRQRRGYRDGRRRGRVVLHAGGPAVRRAALGERDGDRRGPQHGSVCAGRPLHRRHRGTSRSSGHRAGRRVLHQRQQAAGQRHGGSAQHGDGVPRRRRRGYRDGRRRGRLVVHDGDGTARRRARGQRDGDRRGRQHWRRLGHEPLHGRHGRPGGADGRWARQRVADRQQRAGRHGYGRAR